VEKVYSLPDLPRLPYSDLQALLMRLLEYRDFTVLPALFDLLVESGESRLMERVRAELIQFAVDPEYGPENRWAPRWSAVVIRILRYCFHLIWTTEAAVEMLSKGLWEDQLELDPVMPMGMPVVAPAMPTFTAEGDIPAGALVAFDNTNNTVRIHPNPPQENQ